MNATPAPATDEIDVLADRIARTAATIDATTHRLLTDLRRFDAEEGWARQGAVSLAHWLNWRCGIALGAAREKVRVAHALAGLLLIDEALRLGQLSFSKVRAMTRVATADNEANLVELARHSTASQLERICRLYGQTQPRGPEKEAAKRWLRMRDTDDGMVRIEVQLVPEEAARLIKACDVSAETRVDGLLALAEKGLRGEEPDRPPVEVMLHVDAATLAGVGDEVGVAAETSRRLLCDAGVVPVLEDREGLPLDVGRKMRSIPGALRRALLARDGGCRFPGCTHRRFVDGHHIRHWAHGGETNLRNCLLLCSRHHALVHEGGFRVELDGDEVRFFSPRGEDLAVVKNPEPAKVPPPPAPPPVWDGGTVDYAEAVACLGERV